MFHKLHRQMTLFCSAVTGAILLGLSILCLLFATKAVTQTGYTSFQKELASLLTSLQSQGYISHQWLRQMQNERHLTIFLYDNGEPLYYERLQAERSSGVTADAVIEKSGFDIFRSKDGLSLLHEEFPYQSGGARYYASVGYLTRGSGHISFVILYDRTQQMRQLTNLALLIFGADIVTLALLVLFSRRFTGRMLMPLETAQKKQQQFIAAASHELRSPLTVMLSGLESMEKADTPEEKQHFLDLVRQEGERMGHLVSDMLLLANTDARGMLLHPADLAPDELLLSVYEKYEPLALPKQISLQLALIDEDYTIITADEERLTQLLSILVDNAISYTPAGGRVLLLLTQSKGRTVFAVADNGPSIPEEDRARIFERFYRADDAHTDHGHFGLGLCTAQEIAAAHHGRIAVCDLPDCPFLPKNFPKGSGVVFSFAIEHA
ncbi:MAG: HAMP domain-containing histidine kinase [Muribaculaceae bacterium]|nr:HAMP domain-containing histidine kinase [Roseburia sp.]MCM1431429.1 HAMP domain-containing histidine kinase [Muribaculaceae bacterium]MCM1491871.1 HAMP domain-containing histidine kinase [Muribaculaceae bacterium]